MVIKVTMMKDAKEAHIKTRPQMMKTLKTLPFASLTAQD